MLQEEKLSLIARQVYEVVRKKEGISIWELRDYLRVTTTEILIVCKKLREQGCIEIDSDFRIKFNGVA